MRLPVKDGKIDEPGAIGQIHYAIDRGVNYVDTAWPYHAGESEIVLGQGPRRRLPEPRQAGHQAPLMDDQEPRGHGSLSGGPTEKLGTEQIDYYLVHALNGTLWDNVERLGIVDFLEQAKKDGRIVNAGFSFHGLADDFKRIVDAYPWAVCQIQYNYLDEDARRAPRAWSTPPQRAWA